MKSPRHCFAKTSIIDILFSLSHSDVGILQSLSNGVEQSVIGFWIIEIFTWGIYSGDPRVGMKTRVGPRAAAAFMAIL